MAVEVESSHQYAKCRCFITKKNEAENQKNCVVLEEAQEQGSVSEFFHSGKESTYLHSSTLAELLRKSKS